jgi:hypothetical protein
MRNPQAAKASGASARLCGQLRPRATPWDNNPGAESGQHAGIRDGARKRELSLSFKAVS